MEHAEAHRVHIEWVLRTEFTRKTDFPSSCGLNERIISHQSVAVGRDSSC
jgi:hypothetical protein